MANHSITIQVTEDVREGLLVDLDDLIRQHGRAPFRELEKSLRSAHKVDEDIWEMTLPGPVELSRLKNLLKNQLEGADFALKGPNDLLTAKQEFEKVVKATEWSCYFCGQPNTGTECSYCGKTKSISNAFLLADKADERG